MSGEHAEYTVLERKLPATDISLAGATVYTTLEPCTKRGPGKIPCAERLKQRHVSKVYIGTLDPNTVITGKGQQLLQEYNIEVSPFEPDLLNQIRELNQYFFRHQNHLIEKMKEVEKDLESEKNQDLDLDLDIEMQDPDMSRQALRSYVQRAEVRLSTMHRIAGAFISGAGILVILPLLYREGFTIVFETITNFYVKYGAWVCVYIFPCLLPYMLPIISLWFLLRDLTVFYFTANVPAGTLDDDESKRAFHPRFSLTAIPFSDDESPEIKKNMRNLQFNTQLRHFVLPRDKRERNWLNQLLKSEEGSKMALPSESPWLVDVKSGPSSDALRLAFGLAGAYDRKLSEEAAKSELSLIRHNLHLRRLLMRYMKSLLLIILTATMSFALSSGLNVISKDYRLMTAILTFWLWSSIAAFVVRAPARWSHIEIGGTTTEMEKRPSPYYV